MADRVRDVRPAAPRSAAALAHLSWVARRLGRSDEAGAEFEQVYHARREILGEIHPYTLLTQTKLAMLAWERGELDLAEAELEDVRGKRLERLGAKHPQTQWTQQVLETRVGRLVAILLTGGPT